METPERLEKVPGLIHTLFPGAMMGYFFYALANGESQVEIGIVLYLLAFPYVCFILFYKKFNPFINLYEKRLSNIENQISEIEKQSYTISQLDEVNSTVSEIKRLIGTEEPHLIEWTRFGDRIVLLIDSSPLFTYKTIASIYLKRTELEDLIGYGVVINIQSNGVRQIEIQGNLGEDQELSQKIKSDDPNAFQDILIKPTASHDIKKFLED